MLQASVEADPAALDAQRLQHMDGLALQTLLRCNVPLPQQEERARLLREVTLLVLSLPLSLQSITAGAAATQRVAAAAERACQAAARGEQVSSLAIGSCDTPTLSTVTGVPVRCSEPLLVQEVRAKLLSEVTENFGSAGTR